MGGGSPALQKSKTAGRVGGWRKSRGGAPHPGRCAGASPRRTPANLGLLQPDCRLGGEGHERAERGTAPARGGGVQPGLTSWSSLAPIAPVTGRTAFRDNEKEARAVAPRPGPLPLRRPGLLRHTLRAAEESRVPDVRAEQSRGTAGGGPGGRGRWGAGGLGGAAAGR